MAEGDTILRLARRIEAALAGEPLAISAPNPRACFAAGVDPWRSIGRLADEELRAVLFAAREQMLDSVASGRHSPAVYRRRGPCPGCGTTLASRGQGEANRTTYWCPRCQA